MLAFMFSEPENTFMTEIMPRYVYTPNGTIEIQSDLSRANEDKITKFAEALGALGKRPGMTYHEVFGRHASDILKVQIDVKEVLGGRIGHQQEDVFSNFLTNLKHLLPILFCDGDDHIFEPLTISDQGSLGGIYEHFQRWLNAQGQLDERVAMEVLQAMAVPFGRERERAVKREFRLAGGLAKAADLSLAIQNGDFNIYMMNPADPTKDRGSVKWRRAELGSGAGTYRVSRDESMNGLIDVGDDRSVGWLMYTETDGVESPRQVLSLLLGMGALAYRASQYSGREDILANIVWSEE